MALSLGNYQTMGKSMSNARTPECSQMRVRFSADPGWRRGGAGRSRSEQEADRPACFVLGTATCPFQFCCVEMEHAADRIHLKLPVQCEACHRLAGCRCQTYSPGAFALNSWVSKFSPRPLIRIVRIDMASPWIFLFQLLHTDARTALCAWPSYESRASADHHM
jgi:hypothetical protein